METITKIENQNLNQNIPQKNIFKPLFFLFLGLFLAILIILTLFLIKANKTIQITENIISSPTSIPTPTLIPPQISITPTTDPTADWKTYTNSTYKYSIKYPNNWLSKISTDGSLNLTTPENEKAVKEIRKSGMMSEEPDGSYLIACYQNINEYNKGTGTKTLSDYFVKNNDEYLLLDEITINKFHSYIIEMKGMGTGVKGYIIENSNSSFCQISLKNKELTNIENQFINTFKFNY